MTRRKQVQLRKRVNRLYRMRAYGWCNLDGVFIRRCTRDDIRRTLTQPQASWLVTCSVGDMT